MSKTEDNKSIEIKEKTISEKKSQEKKIYTIEDLPGVGAATAEKLRDAGYTDLMSITVASPGELTEATGMGESAAKKLISGARTKLNVGFESGIDLLEKRSKVLKISTGSKAFDAILGGGIESGAITEMYGAYGSGKCCGKDTPIFYFNPDKLHLESISEAYEKYSKKYGEQKEGEGYSVNLSSVDVLGLSKNKLQKTKALKLYREFIEKTYEIKTIRGRKLIVTGPHKLLSFKDSVCWTPAGALKKGDALACPKVLEVNEKTNLTEDDAYFLGVFVAEGSKRGISTGNKNLLRWLLKYIEGKFGFKANVQEDRRRKDICYNIGLRNRCSEFLGSLMQTNASNKFIPESVLQSNEMVVKSFLAGYLDGDGYLPKYEIEVTTKSKKLSVDLSYLFARLGISISSKIKKVDGKKFYRMIVSGDDRLLLNNFPFKIKKANYSVLNMKYACPKNFADYLADVYSETLKGNRGNKEKILGRKNNKNEIFYNYLTKRAGVHSINDKTILRIYHEFENGLKNLKKALVFAEKFETLDKGEFAEFFNLLPFAFNKFSEDVNLSKQALNNYHGRGLPKRNSKIYSLKPVIIKELIKRIEKLDLALKTIKNVMYFKWDVISEIKEIEYNDYVYDFVVPDGHSFVGGEMPTILHNTSLAHQLSVNVTLPVEEGGVDGAAVWIDSEGTLRPEYIKQIAEARGVDVDKVLKNFRGVRSFNSDHQMLLAEKVGDLIKEGIPVKLVIIDSLMSHFRSEFIGRGTLADRQQKLSKHVASLLKLATKYNLAIYITNQVMAKPDTFFGDPTQAIGGHVLHHASTYRVYLRRGKKGTRVAKLVDAPAMPDAECIFRVTGNGLEDV